MALDALAAGKDVYVEKPMTLRLPEALELARVAAASESIVQVGTQYVQIPKYQAARKLIAEGAIGKPVWSQTSFCRNSKAGEWTYYEIDPAVQPGAVLDWEAWCGPLGPRPFDTHVFHRWRRYRDFSTGIVGDLLVHVMTPMIHALDPGWPVHVVATGGHYVDEAMENHDQVNLQVQFESEHTLVVAGSTANAYGFEELIRGHQASLLMAGNNCRLAPEDIYADEVEPQDLKFEGVQEHDEHRLDWFRCIRSREQPRGDVETALKIMVIVDLATRSMWEGGAFKFDPATRSVARA
jgi:predicted dehydrogenase